MIDLSKCPGLERIPGKVSGVWLFRDTRLPLAVVLENLKDGSLNEVCEWFDIEREKVEEVLTFLANQVNQPLLDEDHAPAK
jgi:uncharacterized protein (DUF433 family)